MAGFSYQAMGRISKHSKNVIHMNDTDRELSTTTTMDVGDCLDLLTCVCYLLPCDSVLHDAVEIPLTKTASSEDRSTTQDDFDDCLDTLKEDEQGLIRASASGDRYDLTAIVEDPPMHFAATTRQYGMCPLGHQETIYFK